MSGLPRVAAAGLSLLVLAGCASPASRVILLASPDGQVGKLAVIQGGGAGETVLARANDSATIDKGGKVQTALATTKELAGFDAVRKALPARPVNFVLFFLDDSDRLTEASVARMPDILREVAARPAVEVVVIGHTDRLGALEYNDKLSLSRAESVRDLLLTLKLKPEQVRAEGRGEREPLVPTADETSEPANRRVELSVR